MRIGSQGLKHISILGSRTTLRMKLYQNELEKHSIKSIEPSIEQQEVIAEAVRKVVSNKTEEKDALAIRKIIDDLKIRGAEGVILGCTEIPLLLKGIDLGFPSFDSLHILSEVACEKAYM